MSTCKIINKSNDTDIPLKTSLRIGKGNLTKEGGSLVIKYNSLRLFDFFAVAGKVLWQKMVKLPGMSYIRSATCS